MTKKLKGEMFRFIKSALTILWLNNFITDKEYERINKRIMDRKAELDNE